MITRQTQLQLLVFSAAAFAVLVRSGIYPPELRAINLDFDWFYRGPAVRLACWLTDLDARVRARASRLVQHATQVTRMHVRQCAGVLAGRSEDPAEPRELFLEYQIHVMNVEPFSEHRFE